MIRVHRRRTCLATAASLVLSCSLMVKVSSGWGDKIDMTLMDFPVVVSTNRCSDMDLSGLATAMNCGPPLSPPCFDFNRCRDGPTVYVYDPECSLADSNDIQSSSFENVYRMSARSAGVLADTYESACFFINVEPYTRSEPPCATTTPLWNEGRNHVMIDVSDPARDRRSRYMGSYAIEAATSQHSCYYRSGYDISIGHHPRVVFNELQPVYPEDRRYFLTFRGTLYLEAMSGSEERASVMQLHEEANGVVVVAKCANFILEHYSQHAELCAQLLPQFNAYDFKDLMNSTFALLPAGGSPGTYRLAEVMSAGSIPVFVTRDYVKPFTEQVDWSAFSFTFAPDQVPDMLRTLRSVPTEELHKMQEKSLEAYRRIYGDHINHYLWIARLVIDIVVQRIGHRQS